MFYVDNRYNNPNFSVPRTPKTTERRVHQSQTINPRKLHTSSGIMHNEPVIHAKEKRQSMKMSNNIIDCNSDSRNYYTDIGKGINRYDNILENLKIKCSSTKNSISGAAVNPKWNIFTTTNNSVNVNTADTISVYHNKEANKSATVQNPNTKSVEIGNFITSALPNSDYNRK